MVIVVVVAAFTAVVVRTIVAPAGVAVVAALTPIVVADLVAFATPAVVVVQYLLLGSWFPSSLPAVRSISPNDLSLFFPQERKVLYDMCVEETRSVLLTRADAALLPWANLEEEEEEEGGGDPKAPVTVVLKLSEVAKSPKVEQFHPGLKFGDL